MRNATIQISIIVVMILSCRTESISQYQPHNQIIFLQIEMENDTLKLINSNITQGILKNSRSQTKRPGLYYELKSSTEETLWSGTLDDPLIRRIEFVDDDGNLQSKSVTLLKATFTIRVPFTEKNNHILFYKIENTQSHLDKNQLDSRIIGRIELH